MRHTSRTENHKGECEWYRLQFAKSKHVVMSISLLVALYAYIYIALRVACVSIASFIALRSIYTIWGLI